MIIIMIAHIPARNLITTPPSFRDFTSSLGITIAIMKGSQVFLKNEMEEGVGALRTCTHIQTCGLFHQTKVLKVLTKISKDICFHFHFLISHPGYAEEDGDLLEGEEAC